VSLAYPSSHPGANSSLLSSDHTSLRCVRVCERVCACAVRLRGMAAGARAAGNWACEAKDALLAHMRTCRVSSGGRTRVNTGGRRDQVEREHDGWGLGSEMARNMGLSSQGWGMESFRHAGRGAASSPQGA
jgi:hypothetical protein